MKRLPKTLMRLAVSPRLFDLPYRVAQTAGRVRYTGYLVASAMSLGVDLASFLLLIRMNVPAVRASMLGYTVGLALHWLLSSRLAFADKIQFTATARSRQQLLFVISAFVGLALTAAMVEFGLRSGMTPGLCKLVAVLVSFHVTYLLRRAYVFA